MFCSIAKTLKNKNFDKELCQRIFKKDIEIFEDVYLFEEEVAQFREIARKYNVKYAKVLERKG